MKGAYAMQEKIMLFAFIAAVIIAIKNLIIQAIYVDTSPYKVAFENIKENVRNTRNITKQKLASKKRRAARKKAP